MSVFLSIGITSYKRLSELERCILSLKTIYNDEIEVIVSEDCSPQSNEIGKLVERLEKKVPFILKFMPNEKNLGYDENLGAIIKKCSGEYIFFMSDDDKFESGCLDDIIPVLKRKNKLGVFYSSFIYESTKKLDRNNKNNFEIEKGEKNACKYIYDSILFSGLIFKKDYVIDFDSTRFKNYNYFQVYMFLSMIYKYGGYYFSNPSVVCVGDGENAYGISESSGGNALLANRKSVISNLEFNKTLIKTIKLFDEDNSTHVFNSFEKQYSVHSYSGLSIARQCGIKYYREYWRKLKSLEIKLFPISKIYYVLLFVFGKKVCDIFLKVFKKIKHKDF